MRYIGSKRLLLEEINSVIEENVDFANVFCDIFSGTVSVAKFFKNKYAIISNDLLNFSYVLQQAYIKNNQKPTFDNLKNQTKITNPLEYFNNISEQELQTLKDDKRFFLKNYAPSGNRMYLTDKNALKIDFIRNKIEHWKEQGLINLDEYFYLVACTIEAVPFVSNIAGTYGAFNKWWDKRALNDILLKDLEISSNNRENFVYNLDANELIKQISGDILYVDPPYNNRQYMPNYHVLETVALYDFPKLKGVTGQRDYSDKKSQYCSKATVEKRFEELIKNAKFKHIIISYSTDGLMSIETIENILCKYGEKETFKLYKIPYRKFKSNDKGSKKELSELIFYIRKS